MSDRVTGGWGRVGWGVVLSLCCTGLGHWYGGRLWLGVVLFGISQVSLLLSWALTQGVGPAPWALGVLLAVGVGTALFWVGVAVDAGRRLRGRAAGMVLARRRWFRSTWVGGLGALVVAVGSGSVLPFGWRSFSVPSGSMEPTLLRGETFEADMREGRRAVEAGDVVVFTLVGRETLYVKRVIGMPGDRVSLRDGTVFINGVALRRRVVGEFESGASKSGGVVAVRYVESLASGREFGVLRQSNDGAANTTAEFIVPPGNLFVLGDNRDNSLDSRMPGQFGYVSMPDVIGVAGTVIWPRSWGRFLQPVE